jgi:predicted GIY-YIG superfamily endonuclease
MTKKNLCNNWYTIMTHDVTGARLSKHNENNYVKNLFRYNLFNIVVSESGYVVE